MEGNIIEPVKKIYVQLKNAGFETYLVGGCVRNLLMEKEVTDWDITTSATPEEIQALFTDSFYDNSFGTVGVPFETDESLIEKKYAEVTTFRTESSYEDHRHPVGVVWGTSLIEDVTRRDFTVNALAIELDENSTFKLIDLVDGKKDLDAKVIRAVGNPDDRFKEDALRLMRAVRFATQLNFTIEEQTLTAIKENHRLITHISKERIRDELFKILASENAFKGIEMLNDLGILDLLFPELTRGKGISQERPGRHHTTDVFTHNIQSLKHCPSIDPLVKLSTLLHDVGKPYVQATDEDGYVIFYNHEVVGSKIAKEIAERLRLSKKDKEKMYTLIRWHMFTVDEHITDSAIRRFIRRVGVENVKDIIDLRIGDRLGGGTQQAESWRLKNFKERLEEQLNPPFSINDLVIDGNDIMKLLNLTPGPKVGEVLKTLFAEVDEDLERNNKEFLEKRAREIVELLD